MTAKNLKLTDKIETATSGPLPAPPPINPPFEPVPEDAVPRLLSKLFELAVAGNIPAAKLVLDILEKKFDESHPVFTPEDALKLLQDYFRNAAQESGRTLLPARC